MTVFEIIKRRRSIGKMTEQVPTREQIEQILEAATHAPNHYKTEPWRFFVIAGKARKELGEVMAQSLAERQKDVPQQVLNKERNKPLRSPILIAVTADHPIQPNVIAIENIEATAAAVQNMLLTAEELGLTAVWRTGDAAYAPQLKHWLGLASEDYIVAFIYLGYPATQLAERQPQAADSKTVWLGY